jgi:hypothetical protein
MRYAMLICGDESEWADVNPEELDSGMKETYAWFDKWAGAGKIGDGGAELESVSTARTIRGTGTGDVSVTDGPYLETKEVVGGVVFLECDSFEEAIEVASTWPGLVYRSVSVEVRPTIDHSG